MKKFIIISLLVFLSFPAFAQWHIRQKIKQNDEVYTILKIGNNLQNDVSLTYFYINEQGQQVYPFEYVNENIPQDYQILNFELP